MDFLAQAEFPEEEDIPLVRVAKADVILRPPPRKKRKISNPPEEKWICVFCNQKMPRSMQKEHLNSLAHAKKKREHLQDQALGSTYHCKVCDKWVKTKNRDAHERGKKHLKRLKQSGRGVDHHPVSKPPGLEQKAVAAPLPLDWSEHTDVNSNKKYYFHGPTQHTTWNHPLSKEYALEYQKMILANTPELLKEKKFTDPSRINSYRAAGAKKFEAFCDIMSGGRKRSQKQQKFFYCEICDRKMLYGSMVSHLNGKTHLKKKRRADQERNKLFGKLENQIKNGQGNIISRKPQRVLPPPV